MTAIENLPARMAEVIGSHEWTEFPRSAHNQHNYYAACAVCQRDIPRMAEVALGVRDELVAHLSARAAEAEAKVEHAEAGAQRSSELLAEVRQELAEAKREVSGLRRENTSLREENTRRALAAERDVCSGCMQREQQRDAAWETSRQNGVKYEQTKQAWRCEQDRARRAEAERDRLRLAWQSARERAKAYGDSVGQRCEERDLCEKWFEEAAAERDALKGAIQHLAAEAHRRKWVHEGHPAFSDLHRFGNELLATLTAPAEGTTTPVRETA